MNFESIRRCASAVLFVGAAASSVALAGAEPLSFPEGVDVPRSMTKAEQAWVAEHPIVASNLRGSTPPPAGPVFCPPEYAPVEAIMVSWEGSAAFLAVLASMGAVITNQGNADLIVNVDNAAEQATATTSLSGAGVNMSRVKFVVRTTDTVWVRDYGPRYIYEGDCRAIVDHTYNRPRPNDDLLPQFFATQKRQALYEIPLVHGGGNYHLDGLNRSRATRLINNENPGLSESQIIGFWQQYQNLATELHTPFPTAVDLTQHIDMWLQIAGDNVAVVSDWPNNAGSTQDQICDAAALDMQGEGYTVHRIPARVSGGTHFTFTNVVMCNGIVLVPQYTLSPGNAHNAEALTVWRTVMGEVGGGPQKVFPINADSVVTSAGVLHCIVMHIPLHRGGQNPTAYLKSFNGGENVEPGQQHAVQWISDDNLDAARTADILLSLDGGATFPVVIASNIPDSWSFNWTVPNVSTAEARLRVVVRDSGALTGSDDSDADFAIAPPCPADITGDGQVGSADLAALLGAWGPGGGPADLNGDGQVNSGDLASMLGAWGPCP